MLLSRTLSGDIVARAPKRIGSSSSATLLWTHAARNFDDTRVTPKAQDSVAPAFSSRVEVVLLLAAMLEGIQGVVPGGKDRRRLHGRRRKGSRYSAPAGTAEIVDQA